MSDLSRRAFQGSTSALLAGTGPFTKTPGWLDWYQNPSTPRFEAAGGIGGRPLPRFGPGARVPLRDRNASTPRAMRARINSSRCVTTWGSVATSSFRRPATERTTARWSTPSRRPAAGPAASPRSAPTSPTPSCAGSTRRACEECGSTSSAPGRGHPEGRPDHHRAEDRPPGLAYRHLFRGPRPGRPGGFLRPLPTPLVVDHMGRPDVTRPVDGPEFSRFLSFVARNEAWVKVSCPERLTVTGPPALNGEQNAYTDVVPFSRRVVEEFPDSVLWGTDWPHPNLTDHMPDDGLLVDHIPHVATTAGTAAQAPRGQPDAPVLAG